MEESNSGSNPGPQAEAVTSTDTQDGEQHGDDIDSSSSAEEESEDESENEASPGEGQTSGPDHDTTSPKKRPRIPLSDEQAKSLDFAASLPFSILHTAENNVSFFQDPRKGASVFMAQPLRQHIPANLYWLRSFARLNMCAAMPELGVVAVASQVGRVAILTLTRIRETKHRAFRLDWILPLKSQEDAKMRPEVPLLGIASAPVQGREAAIVSPGRRSPDGLRGEAWRAVESSRRYRLLLTYCDHTVLSYELGRVDNRKSKDGVKGDLFLF